MPKCFDCFSFADVSKFRITPIKLHVLKLHQIDSIQIIPKNGIIVVQLLPQVRVDNECAIVLSEV
jgi:hypothetical protein